MKNISELEQLIITSTDCNEHEAKIKAKRLSIQYVVKNPEVLVKIQTDVLNSFNYQIAQNNEDKFILASNHMAFMHKFDNKNNDKDDVIDFLEIKHIDLQFNGESFDNFVLSNKLGLSKK
jgi:hypothetical protein